MMAVLHPQRYQRDADIPYLLDDAYKPHHHHYGSYASTSSSPSYLAPSPLARTTIPIYVDAQGRMHDPDYRMFDTGVPRPLNKRRRTSVDDDEDAYEARVRKQYIDARSRPSASSPSAPPSPIPFSSARLPSYSPPDPSSPFTYAESLLDDEDYDQDERASISPSESKAIMTGCFDAVRRQWQLVGLSIRLGLFRTKRRVTHSMKQRRCSTGTMPRAL